MEVPELDFIEKQIYWIYVFEYLQYYLNAKSESEDKHSVVLLCSWLKMNLGSVPDTAKTECESLLHDICAKLKKSEDELLEVNEECPLCFNPVKFESHNFGSCTEHTFGKFHFPNYKKNLNIYYSSSSLCVEFDSFIYSGECLLPRLQQKSEKKYKIILGQSHCLPYL